MITVEVPVDCGGVHHSVVLKIDTRGRARCLLVDHDQKAEVVLESLGSPPSACGTARRAMANLRSSIPYALERALWLRIGVRNEDDLEAWHEAGVRNPSVAERWLWFTDGALVGAWRNRGFKTPAEAMPWALAGFDPDGSRLWVEAGKTVDEAIEWSSRGVAFATGAVAWGHLGVASPAAMRPWVRAGVTSGSDAEVWARLGVCNPSDVREWLRAGAVDAVDAAAMDPRRRRLRRGRGPNPDLASSWVAIGT